MSARASCYDSGQRGFTLVEMIVVMVLTGILGGMTMSMIRNPVRNYVNAAARADLADTADLALRRMTRELHGALPNSIRLSSLGLTTMLEFIPTKAGGTYLSVEDLGGGNPLSFTDTSLVKFDVLGTMPAAPYNIVAGDSIVVYNLGAGYTYGDAYLGDNRVTVTGLGTGVNGNTVSFVDPTGASLNPYAKPYVTSPTTGTTPNASPTNRFSVVGQPVSFVCVANPNGKGTIKRYWNYGFKTNQPSVATMSAGSSALLANGVLTCQFAFTQLANVHSGLLGMAVVLASTVPTDGNLLETVSMAAQIHVDNTP